ncbi:MAG: hypothetical protein OQL19_04100 [Gammaproteobacteria bacterium]|nr:hypothetical protein [Gammaproteobacteria bacterium]
MMQEIIYVSAMLIGTALTLFYYHFIGVFFFYLGWPFVKLFTLGKYPVESNVLNFFKKGDRESGIVAGVGMIVMALVVTIIYM